MNDKSPIPDELILIDKQFSWRTAWNTNRWLLLAFTISLLSDVLFPRIVWHWPLAWRVTVVTGIFLPIVLGIFDVARWIRRMDELQRRSTVAAIFFSVSATFFVMLLWLYLDNIGFFRRLFGPPFWNNTWGIYTFAHAYALLGGFYGIGFLIFKRRYK
ncbi:MAG: hypothetical protein ACLPYZ_17570 [Limisphaerales bacterium]